MPPKLKPKLPFSGGFAAAGLIGLMALSFPAAVAAADSTPEEADSRILKGGRALYSAEKTFFTFRGFYTGSFTELRDRAGHVPDPDVCYSEIETYRTGSGVPAFRFSAGHADRDSFSSAYLFDSAADGAPLPVSGTFACVPSGSAESRSDAPGTASPAPPSEPTGSGPSVPTGPSGPFGPSGPSGSGRSSVSGGSESRAVSADPLRSASRAVVTAQEALFASEGRYAATYEELRDKAGLQAEKTVCYGAIRTFGDPRTGDAGYAFAVGRVSGHAGAAAPGEKGPAKAGGGGSERPEALLLESFGSEPAVSSVPDTFSCLPFGGSRGDPPPHAPPVSPGPAGTDARIREALRAVAAAEEAHFVSRGSFTASYAELMAAGGLVPDPSVCYSDIRLSESLRGTPAFSFAAGNAGKGGIRTAYVYDTASSEIIGLTPDRFECQDLEGGGK
ncbi:MAG: hypothetical protein LBQ79_02180 [Deltaproteobacteria bacterium]|jgi:hypothetical protein|nr:hypothetical protein [Deltaproteobacteria bacterium]